MSRMPFIKLSELVPPVRFVVCRTGKKYQLDANRRITDEATGEDWSGISGQTKVKPIIRLKEAS